MTEDDEYALYDCSREHIFTFIDDSQRDEFSSLFGCKQRDWEKIEITIYKIDPEKATCSINDNEQIGEYFILFGDERLSVNPNPGYSLQGWN